MNRNNGPDPNPNPVEAGFLRKPPDGPRSDSVPAADRSGPPPQAVEAPDGPVRNELNGAFLKSYDARRAEPQRLGMPAWYHRHVLKSRSSLVLQATQAGSAPEPVPELILDDDNLLPFHFLRTGDRLGRAVVKILRDDGAAGTGFLVAPGILLTNHHVLPNAAIAAAAQAHANYEIAPPPDPAGRLAVVRLKPDVLFVSDAELDFTFCGVEGLDDLGHVALDRDSLNILPSEYVNIVQHPRGRPKEVALQDNRVVKVDNVVVHYCCDTEPGSSGSPVFNNQWQLVALHHASVVADGSTGRMSFGVNPGMRFLNEGIRISAIAVWLETMEPRTAGDLAQVERLRGIFAGLDPQIGYFGALGRRSAGRSAAEAVVECYHGQDRSLDLGFWNLSGLGSSPSAAISELGWIIAGMKIDVWCLTHLDDEALRSLCRHLESHFRQDYQYLATRTASRQPVAFLYRRSSRFSAEWLSPPDDPGTRGDRSARIRLRARDRSGSATDVVIVPVPRAEPGRRREPLAARMPVDRDGPLVFLGDGIGSRDIHKFSVAGTPLRAVLGADGAFVLSERAVSTFETIFASPNLNLTYGAAENVVIARNRSWPEGLEALGGRRPIAVRLARTGAAPIQPSWIAPVHAEGSHPNPQPGTEMTLRSDPPTRPLAGSHLEQAIREILSRFEAESRRREDPG